MKVIKKAKQHQVYKQKAGNRVKGITTIVKHIESAQPLINWANKLGLQGMEAYKYVDELANIGTCLHYFVECDLQNMKRDLGDYTGNQIARAEQCFLKYEDWKKQHTLVTIAMEKPLVSELHPFGGTGDWFGIYDGDLAYIDFKTSKACYVGHKVQAVACTKLWEEHTGDLPKHAKILRVGRSMDEGFEEITIPEDLKDPMWKAFTYACKIEELTNIIDPYKSKKWVKK